MPRRRSRAVNLSGLRRPAGPHRPLQGEALAPGLRVGLFGGSFDPPHRGHMHVAITAMRRLNLDRIWWLVSPQNPLKSRRAGTLQDRIERVRAFVDHPRMVVSDIEDRLHIQHTAGLIESLINSFSNNNFVWIMGADNLAGFHRWQDWRMIVDSVPIAVIARPQDPIRARLSKMASCYRRSRLREAAAKNLPLKLAPAWTYLIEPLQSDSSTQLRNKS